MFARGHTTYLGNSTIIAPAYAHSLGRDEVSEIFGTFLSVLER